MNSNAYRPSHTLKKIKNPSVYVRYSWILKVCQKRPEAIQYRVKNCQDMMIGRFETCLPFFSLICFWGSQQNKSKFIHLRVDLTIFLTRHATVPQMRRNRNGHLAMKMRFWVIYDPYYDLVIPSSSWEVIASVNEQISPWFWLNETFNFRVMGIDYEIVFWGVTVHI